MGILFFYRFIRQLHFYCFKKSEAVAGKWSFSHPNFQRDCPELIKDIRRKTRLNTTAFASKVDLEGLRTVVHELKAKVEAELHSVRAQLGSIFKILSDTHCLQEFKLKGKNSNGSANFQLPPHYPSNMFPVTSNGISAINVAQPWYIPGLSPWSPYIPMHGQVLNHGVPGDMKNLQNKDVTFGAIRKREYEVEDNDNEDVRTKRRKKDGSVSLTNSNRVSSEKDSLPLDDSSFTQSKNSANRQEDT